VGFFGELIEGIKHLAKKASHAIVKAAHAVVRWVRQHASTVKTIDCMISGGGAGVLAGVGASFFTKSLYIGGTIGSAVAAGVQYACEHQ